MKMRRFSEDVDDVETAVQQPGTATERETAKSGKYDGHKRAPEHANADHSCAWEVLPFLAHFHPSVTVSADHYIHHTRPYLGSPT